MSLTVGIKVIKKELSEYEEKLYAKQEFRNEELAFLKRRHEELKEQVAELEKRQRQFNNFTAVSIRERAAQSHTDGTMQNINPLEQVTHFFYSKTTQAKTKPNTAPVHESIKSVIVKDEAGGWESDNIKTLLQYINKQEEEGPSQPAEIEEQEDEFAEFNEMLQNSDYEE